MQAGRAVMDRSISNLFFFGFGSSQLVFRLDTGPRAVVLGSWDTSRAYRCPSCGALTIATDPDA